MKQLNPTTIKKDFPLFDKYPELVYLDSAATSQKPAAVLHAIQDYYATSNANVHRGVHRLSDQSTTVFEHARTTIAHFFGAESDELILVRNTTEALNGFAYGWGDAHLNAKDIILASALDHHSNLVVWQQLAHRTGAELVTVPPTTSGRYDLEAFKEIVQRYQIRIKLIAVSLISNTTGSVLDLNQLQATTKAVLGSQAKQLRWVVDAAQAAPHMPLNFKKLQVDALAFSGHKMLGPMGSGGLIVRRSLLESHEMRPWLFGGGMISRVSESDSEFHPESSDRFSPGTPDVASAVGLAAACDYLSKIGMPVVYQHDVALVSYAYAQLEKVAQVRLLGPTPKNAEGQVRRLGSVAFTYQGVHAHDVAQILDSQAVAVRSGHHCTMPLHAVLQVQASVRASFHVYTSKSDIDALITALKKVKQVFGT